MLLKIDFHSEVPIYLQLRHQIVEGIACGALPEGSALPSVRQLASDLDVNMHTVNKTYSMLESEGFVVVHKREGFVVRPAAALQAKTEHLEQIRAELRPIVAEAIARGISESALKEICAELFLVVMNGDETK